MSPKVDQQIEHHLSDADYLELIKQRDESGLRQLMQAYGGQVLGLSRRMLPDAGEAECVTSDVFLTIWNRPSLFEASRGTLFTLLMTMARSRSIDRLRQQANRERSLEKYRDHSESKSSHDDISPGTNLLRQECRQQISASINALPVTQREAVRLAFFVGQSHREVAETMQLPLGSVKTAIRKGLMALKSALEMKPEFGDIHEL